MSKSFDNLHLTTFDDFKIHFEFISFWLAEKWLCPHNKNEKKKERKRRQLKHGYLNAAVAAKSSLRS